jgi:HAD superfamily hydrolase (TIGR01509 family)
VSELTCEAVVFDLDGTLIDTEPFYRAAFHRAARMFGVTVQPELYAALVGIATSERRAILRRAFGAGFPLDAFVAAYYTQRAAHLPARIPLCAGAASLLRRLHLPKAIATSASRRTALRHMHRAGLAGNFPHIVTRDEVAHGKPAPDTFLRAADLLGCAPRDCIAIEDSAVGVAAAHRAGMRVVMIATNASPETRRCCIAVVPRLEAVPDLSSSPLRLAEPCATFIRCRENRARERPSAHRP